MANTPINLGQCDLIITRSDGSREISTQPANAEVILRSHSPAELRSRINRAHRYQYPVLISHTVRAEPRLVAKSDG